MHLYPTKSLTAQLKKLRILIMTVPQEYFMTPLLSAHIRTASLSSHVLTWTVYGPMSMTPLSRLVATAKTSLSVSHNPSCVILICQEPLIKTYGIRFKLGINGMVMSKTYVKTVVIIGFMPQSYLMCAAVRLLVIPRYAVSHHVARLRLPLSSMLK